MARSMLTGVQVATIHQDLDARMQAAAYRESDGGGRAEGVDISIVITALVETRVPEARMQDSGQLWNP